MNPIFYTPGNRSNTFSVIIDAKEVKSIEEINICHLLFIHTSSERAPYPGVFTTQTYFEHHLIRN